ncbi:hypothetical protein C1646_819427 [Rhizophagus diaphanus]|nr:hypothetical protein C1646_819427 [Rhizophagus diaphanus] [Rhizophagus sp. MUCL 43196]
MSILTDYAEVTIKTIVDPPSYPSPSAWTVCLKLTDNLLEIRQELEKKKSIDNTLLFLNKYPENNNNDNIIYGSFEIKLEEEENYLLNEVIDENNILYLKQYKQCLEHNWKYFNELYKLDYGCTMTLDGIDRADKRKKRAFVMENCELTELTAAEGYRKGSYEYKPNNDNHDRIMKKNLLFSNDINVESLEKLGISIGNMETEGVNSENIASYHFTKYGKVSLKFDHHLKPTKEFIDEVNEAIKSECPAREFKQITEQYGQFIPTIVILGGRAHYDERVTPARCSVLIGGEQSYREIFDEKAWLKSLENYKNWCCIELQGLNSIFQFVPDDIRKRIFVSVGKRIHHSDFVYFNYKVEEFGKPNIFEFSKLTPPNILNIIKNKEADCNVLATAKSKKGFFTCQVLYPPGGIPNLIIHCIQKKFKKRQCKLEIGWMVIGYWVDFNFLISDFNNQLRIFKNENKSNGRTIINTQLSLENSVNDIPIPLCLGSSVLTKLDASNDSLVIGYLFFEAQERNKIGACTFSYCLKNKKCVKLPIFTFYTLIISKYHVPSAYRIIPFGQSLNEPCIDNITLNPTFLSLYLTQRTNYGPIFLKQKNKKIKPEIINCKNSECIVCENKTLKISIDRVKCVFFDPYIRENSV